MAKRYLYLVRHGEYTSTPAPSDLPDGPLTEIGRQQATAVGHRLQDLPISAIHCSNLIRAAETATIIATAFPGVTPQPTKILRECIPSVPPEQQSAFEKIPSRFLEGGEAQARAAYDQYMREPATSDEYEIIVSSGNLLCYFVTRSLNAPIDSWILTDINHGGVSEIILGPPHGVLVLRHNDISHLPVTLQTKG